MIYLLSGIVILLLINVWLLNIINENLIRLVEKPRI